MDGLLKYDLQSGLVERLRLPTGYITSEQSFAPRIGGRPEDDGFLVGFVTDTSSLARISGSRGAGSRGSAGRANPLPQRCRHIRRRSLLPTYFADELMQRCNPRDERINLSGTDDGSGPGHASPDCRWSIAPLTLTDSAKGNPLGPAFRGDLLRAACTLEGGRTCKPCCLARRAATLCWR